jgi:RNA polymerase sigma factor (sigma-70 family)
MRNGQMQSQSQSENEDILISECVQGKMAAQRTLYERYSKKMYVVALRYAKTTFEAEDILQESFVKIFNNLPDFHRDCPLEYWIKRIIINTALKHNRRKIDKSPTEDISEMTDEPSEEVIISDYNFKELLSMIQALAPGYQVIFNLYAIEGFKHKEIAEMLDITEGTSKSQYARAKVILQKMLAKDESAVYEKLR